MRPFEAGEIIAGKYILQRPLAKGGMGSVWAAWNDQLDVPVAIKFMTVEGVGSAELVARFEREAKAAAQLRVPQVVQIYEHGVHQGLPFMAMELLEGEDLNKRLRARGRLTPAETARILGEVLKALRRANELGIVHRDLKPANVFLSRHGDDEVVKVLDFGIAKMLAAPPGGDATKTGALLGTPNYMSPEQASRGGSGKVDHRSDLWSVGVIAYRALTGKLPYAGDNAMDILMRLWTEEAPPASSMASDLPPGADAFFARALARDPARRFQTAREMAEALSALAESAPKNVPGPAWSGEGPRGGQPSNPSWGGEGPGAAPPLGSSWNRPPPAVPPPRASDPGARAASGTPQAPSGGAAQGPGLRGTPPLDAPPVASQVATSARAGRPSIDARGEGHDPLDFATTVPIQKSPAAQAYAANALGQTGGGPAAGAAGDPQSPGAPGMTRQASSPRGFGAPPSNEPQGHASAPHAPWEPAAAGTQKPFVLTMPLGNAAALHARTLEAPQSQGMSDPGLTSASATTSAESDGTITSATGELPSRRKARTSFVVWAALAAAVLVVIVVGTVVWSSLASAPEGDELIVLPSATSASPLVPDPPTSGPRVTPSGWAPQVASSGSTGTLPAPMSSAAGSQTSGDSAQGAANGTPSANAPSTAPPASAAAASASAKGPAPGGKLPPGKAPRQGTTTKGQPGLYGEPVFGN